MNKIDRFCWSNRRHFYTINNISIKKKPVDYSNLIIDYYDLGIERGWEIDQFINFAEKNNVEYNVFGFEACLDFYNTLIEKYALNKNISLEHLAISNTDDDTIKLYHSNSDDGHSIISSKNNLIDVDNNYEYCNTIKLSTFIRSKIKYKGNKNHIKILKANIEGAEYHLIKDLHESKMLGYFDYYIGTGYLGDITKCYPLGDKVNEIKKIFKDNKIISFYFARGSKQEANVPFESLLMC
jgi:FkbM family methyltransferase